MARRDRLVYERANKANVPLAIAMGGGYANDLDDIVDIHAQTVALAYDDWFLEGSNHSDAEAQRGIE